MTDLGFTKCQACGKDTINHATLFCNSCWTIDTALNRLASMSPEKLEWWIKYKSIRIDIDDRQM